MHPLLALRRGLLVYLAAWLPVAGLLVYVVGASGGPGWLQAAGAIVPGCLVYAFVCLSPLYICRIRPLTLAGAPALLLTWMSAAVFASLVLLASVRFAATFIFADGNDPLRAQYPVLFGIGVMLYLLSAGLHYAAIAVLDSRDAERRAAEARTLAREAELRALKAQINPHFLFNSLHAISALATADGSRAREMCVRLSDFLRSSLALGARESVPLREEMALARLYLDIERLRFGSRLHVDEDIEPGCEECNVPALLLQPLVENAVKHGVAGLVEGGSISLSARRSASAIAIVIANEFDADAVPGRTTGLGLANVKRRLEVRYGREADFRAAPSDSVYRVELRFPCEPPIASSSRS
jgi:hypothetical protein